MGGLLRKEALNRRGKTANFRPWDGSPPPSSRCDTASASVAHRTQTRPRKRPTASGAVLIQVAVTLLTRSGCSTTLPISEMVDFSYGMAYVVTGSNREAAMTNHFLSALRDEIAALDAELRQDDRYVRLQALRQVLPHYERTVSPMVPPVAQAAHQTEASEPRSEPKPPLRQPSEARVLAERYSEEYIAGRTYPTPTRELYEMLRAKGVEIGGKQPTSNLSAILSKSGKVVSMGRAGWVSLEVAKQIEAIQPSDLTEALADEGHASTLQDEDAADGWSDREE